MPMLTTARTVVVFGLILQVAGFAKLLVTAAYFGAGPVLDAYYLGLVIPAFVTGVATGLVQAIFVPAYVGARVRADTAALSRLVDTTLTLVAAVTGAIAVVLVTASGTVVPLLARHSNPETLLALQASFAFLMWSLPLNALADSGALVLNAEGRFTAAAAAPLVNAIVGIVVLVAMAGSGIDALVSSLMAGLVAQALVILSAIRRAGIRWRPRLKLPAALPRLLGVVALPVVLTTLAANFVPAFIQLAASRAGPGAVSAMGYAWRLNNSLVQAVVLSVSVILLPHFARLIAEGKTAELRATLERVFAAALMFSLAALVLIAAGGPSAVSALLQRGRFTAANAELVAGIWLALTAGLFGTTWSIFLIRLFQAQQQLWIVCALGVVALLANVVFVYALLPAMGVAGVALANSLAYTLVMCLWHLRAHRQAGRIISLPAAGFIVRTLLANLAAYGLALLCAGVLAPVSQLATLIVQSVIVAACNLIVAGTAPLRVSLALLLRR
jgi:murein biosynthesis integral membrane protein MurJ